MSFLLARLAWWIVRVAAALLPSSLRSWALAMQSEVHGIARPGAALRFALGCLGFVLWEIIWFPARQSTGTGNILSCDGDESMRISDALSGRPQRLGALCAMAATGLGLTYMAMAGAPLRYLVLNASALAIGFAVVGLAAAAARTGRVPTGYIILALAIGLMATSLFGVRVDGASRWIMVAGLSLQPSLIILPVMAVCFARARDRLSMIALIIAAMSLAIQPDRAMAGALAVATMALALIHPCRNIMIAFGASACGFAVTLLRPDVLPAMPFVDQIVYSSFDVHPFAGVAVLAGAALMVVPAVVGYATDPAHRGTYAVFGAVWFAIIAAAALGNYPTPVVGYGGSAIIGYVVSLMSLPKFVRTYVRDRGNTVLPIDQTEQPYLFSAMLSRAI